MLFMVIPTLQLGGAMAPAIKELSRWLDANSEYYVAPDWADVVKHSVSIRTETVFVSHEVLQANRCRIVNCFSFLSVLSSLPQ